MKKTICLTIIFTILLSMIVMPFNFVYAEDVYDSDLVYYGPQEDLQVQESTKSGSSQTLRNRYIRRPAYTQTVFATFTSSGYGQVAAYTFSTVADQSYYAWRETGNGVTNTAWRTTGGESVTYVYDNVTYYVYYSKFNGQYGYQYPDLNIATTLGNNNTASFYYNETTIAQMFKYTGYYYGIDDDEFVEGDLKVNFYTDFASSIQNRRNAIRTNRDTIVWEYDSTDSNIPLLDLKVDIRAVPTNYNATSTTALESYTWQNLNLYLTYSSDLGSYQINNNQASFTWGEVIDNFSLSSNLPDWMDQVLDYWGYEWYNYDNKFYRSGWVYQVRLNTWSGDYTGEWQTVYTSQAAPPSDSQTIINYYVNGNGVTEPIYQTIQNINNQNNITNNNWYVNGTPYNIDDDSGSNWWEQLLQFISDLVGQILSFLGNIFDSLIESIFDVINNLGIDFLGLITSIINGINDFFDNLDLTGINFQLPSSFSNLINSFAGSVNGILSIWFNNSLGVFIMIPLIIWLIGVVL